MGALYQQHRIERVLVVAPTSVCSVWPHDLQQFAAFPYHCETLLGEKKKRLEGLDALEVWPFASLKIAVINYESTHRDGIFDALVEYDADLIICDESQRIKNHSAAQSKALHKLGDKARYKLALSGTPVQNNAVDLYSQYRFLDSAVFGSNFFAFRNRYCVMGGYGQHQIVGYQHMEQLIQKEHSIAYRVTKAECLDLPPQTFENRYVKFSPAERKLYDQLRKSSFAELAGGDSKSYRPGDSVDIQDASAAKELLAVGFIVTRPGEYAPGETLTVDVQHEPEDGVATGHLNKEELEAMPKAQLLTLAENMGLDTKDLTKAKLVEAIAAAEVQAEV